MRRITGGIIALVLLAAAITGFHVYSPLVLPSEPFEFSLKPGTSLKSAARQLERSGLLDQDATFVLLARVLGKSGAIKAGNYALEHPVSRLELLTIITKGSVSQSQISVIEGWTFRQLRAVLDASPDITHHTKDLSDTEILQRIGAAENHPEGLFFPDTYYFDAGSSDLTIFRVAYHTMKRHLNEAWESRVTDLPLETPYQALILASIVEKETGAPSDRQMIAGVFVNRLKRGMLLQTDPTVIYGLGDKFDGNLRKRDLLADTPYNTYTRKGLTPTPIALPGTAALHAALHPAKTDALYFVARGDGSSEFSSSLKAHNLAVEQYQLKRKSSR